MLDVLRDINANGISPNRINPNRINPNRINPNRINPNRIVILNLFQDNAPPSPVILKRVQDDDGLPVILKRVQDDEWRSPIILKQVQDDDRWWRYHQLTLPVVTRPSRLCRGRCPSAWRAL